MKNKLFLGIFIISFFTFSIPMEEPEESVETIQLAPIPEKPSLGTLPFELIYKIVLNLLPKTINSKDQLIQFIKELSRLSMTNTNLYVVLQDSDFLDHLSIEIARRFDSISNGIFITDNALNYLREYQPVLYGSVEDWVEINVNPLFIYMLGNTAKTLKNVDNSIKQNNAGELQKLLVVLNNKEYGLYLLHAYIYTIKPKLFTILLKFTNPSAAIFKPYISKLLLPFFTYNYNIKNHPQAANNDANDAYKKLKKIIKLGLSPNESIQDPVATYSINGPLLNVIMVDSVNNLNKKYIKLIFFLLERGANINGIDSSGSTPLISLCRNKPSPLIYKLVQLFLKHGANVNVIDKLNSSAFSLAAHHDNLPIVKLLLQYANPKTLNPEIIKKVISIAVNKDDEQSKLILEAIDTWAIINNFEY